MVELQSFSHSSGELHARHYSSQPENATCQKCQSLPVDNGGRTLVLQHKALHNYQLGYLYLGHAGVAVAEERPGPVARSLRDSVMELDVGR